VIDEIEKQLSLGRAAAEPSRASLFRYGNVSSSSIWWVAGVRVGRGGAPVARAARCCARSVGAAYHPTEPPRCFSRRRPPA
jgi:predicted naringenin-chalcone synthase